MSPNLLDHRDATKKRFDEFLKRHGSRADSETAYLAKEALRKRSRRSSGRMVDCRHGDHRPIWVNRNVPWQHGRADHRPYRMFATP